MNERKLKNACQRGTSKRFILKMENDLSCHLGISCASTLCSMLHFAQCICSHFLEGSTCLFMSAFKIHDFKQHFGLSRSSEERIFIRPGTGARPLDAIMSTLPGVHTVVFNLLPLQAPPWASYGDARKGKGKDIGARWTNGGKGKDPEAGSAGLHTTASQVVAVRPARVAHGSGGLTCRVCSWASTTRTRMADRFVSHGTFLEDAQRARMEPATAAFTCVPSASERTLATNARRKGPTDYRCQCKASLLPLPRRPDDYTHFFGLKIFAGSAGLTAALKSIGLRGSFGIDSVLYKVRLGPNQT